MNYLLTENQKYKNLLNHLIQISLESLHEMYVPEREEFSVKKKIENEGTIVEESAIRYTLINLIGLFKAESNGFEIKMNLGKILNYQVFNSKKLSGVGEIGLLLWATSLICPEKIENILTKINFNNILEDYKDANNKLTMELSWLLTGLLMASTFNQVFKESIGNLPEEVYKLLRNNYGGMGIFKHQGSHTLIGKFRSNLASFADQVYPIYALSLYSQQKKNKEALLISKECALKLCENQGKNGEWYWHYDSKTGKVVSKYPIYSVHQDAMAPMALFAIQRASNINFESYIFKGINWLLQDTFGDGKIFEPEKNLLWHAIQPATTHRKFKSTLYQLGFSSKEEYNDIRIVKESWSYHYGLILFAFAGRVNNAEVKSDLSSKDSFKIYNFN